MAYHNNGRKYYHIIRCDGHEHVWATQGMWYGVEEKLCPRHKTYGTVIKSNMTKNDAEHYEPTP